MMDVGKILVCALPVWHGDKNVMRRPSKNDCPAFLGWYLPRAKINVTNAEALVLKVIQQRVF